MSSFQQQQNYDARKQIRKYVTHTPEKKQATETPHEGDQMLDFTLKSFKVTIINMFSVLKKKHD